MKKINPVIFSAVVAITLSLSGKANAQFKVNEDDGIAASPKVRQMLNERKASTSVVSFSGSTSTIVSFAMGPGASPKVQQMRTELKSTSVGGESSLALVGYRPTGTDGIAASPKVRQQLNERSGAFVLAPIK